MCAKRWKDLNPAKLTLASLKEHFEVFNRSEGKSRKTAAWYNETLQDFIRYLEREGMAPIMAVADELAVRRYILDLQSRQSTIMSDPYSAPRLLSLTTALLRSDSMA